jgi:putative ABC transport system permease protein
MKKLPMWRRYLLFWGRKPEADVEREFRFHLEMRTQELIDQGKTPEDAGREAERCFGNADRFRAECKTIDDRMERRLAMMERLEIIGNDAMHTVRQLCHNPGFTAVTIFTLGLAIGANAAIFSVLHGVVLQPLPYHEPDRLVSLWESTPEPSRVTAANYLDWRAKNDVFEDVAIIGSSTLNLTGEGEPEQLRGARVSAGYFPLLGIQPILGRWFTAEEDVAGGPAVVLIDEGLWRRRFGADAGIVGKTIQLNSKSFTVLGVMPEGPYPSWPATSANLQFDAEYHRFWTPLAMAPQLRSNRFSHVFAVIARLKNDISIESAQTSMDGIGRSLAEAYPRTNRGEGILIKRLTDEIVGDVRTGLVILQVSVGFVLLIACANVTGLAIARLSSRRREIAVRTALGAGRSRLIGQFLAEGIVLSLAGGILGVAGAGAALRVLTSLAPPDFPRLDQVHLGSTTILFTAILCGLTILMFGLLPAIHASRSNPQDAISDGGRSSTAGASRHRVRRLLVTGQVTIAAMLLIGSALLVESFRNLRHVSPGFNPQRLLAAELSLPTLNYAGIPRISAFADSFLEKIRALPGVDAAAIAYDHPLKANWIDSFSIAKRPTEAGRDSPSAYYRIVSEGYFEAAGIPLVRGRSFNTFDNVTAKGAVIINEAFADKFFPGEDPIGETLDVRTPRAIWGAAVPEAFEIVGLVKDTRFLGIDQPPAPAFYVPFSQCPNGSFVALVKTRNNPDSIVPALRSIVWSIDPNQPIASTRSMDRIIDDELARPRFHMFVMTIFGIVALILACVGLYGLLAYLVSQRTPEIGIRVALGASSRDIYRLVVGQGLWLALIGVLAGLAGALALTRTLEKLLFGVSARDPMVFSASALLLLVVVIIACSIPAIRATSVDPASTLKAE